ncbi:hypothetical protein MFFC18_10170 [Mariniblastus fucicola]|uniref:Uncharacterized protein n=1 Tax=Mariniblastus fucicola TaxID=980251 RepID=A0A5B9PDZ3_9BACT|nr:hypothetical protein MFFC18_10170 [Mariniblastus fucicola]
MGLHHLPRFFPHNTTPTEGESNATNLRRVEGLADAHLEFCISMMVVAIWNNRYPAFDAKNMSGFEA